MARAASMANKCCVLGQFWLLYRDDAAKDEYWRDFFAWADIGLPLAAHAYGGYAKLTQEGRVAIDATWIAFCSAIEIDPNGNYASIDEAFAVSDHGPVEAK